MKFGGKKFHNFKPDTMFVFFLFENELTAPCKFIHEPARHCGVASRLPDTANIPRLCAVKPNEATKTYQALVHTELHEPFFHT